MNKRRRFELKMLKFKKRMKLYGFKKDLSLNGEWQANLYAFRSHSCPCSCFMCSGNKYDRASVKRETQKMLQQID